jgi:hypothetical protein
MGNGTGAFAGADVENSWLIITQFDTSICNSCFGVERQ